MQSQGDKRVRSLLLLLLGEMRNIKSKDLVHDPLQNSAPIAVDLFPEKLDIRFGLRWLFSLQFP